MLGMTSRQEVLRMNKITIAGAKGLIEDASMFTDKGHIPDALNNLNKTIRGLQLDESVHAKIMISKAQTMIGFNLALQALKLQGQNKDLSSKEINETWKPVFSCFGTAIAYQTAIGNTSYRAVSLSLDTAFKLKMGKLNLEKETDKIYIEELGGWMSHQRNKTDSTTVKRAQQFFFEIRKNSKKDPFDILEFLDPEW